MSMSFIRVRIALIGGVPAVFLAALLSVSQPTKVQAAEDPTVWVGGGYGISVPNKNNTTSRPIFGLTAGAKIGSEFGVGVRYLSSQKDESVDGVSVPWNFDLYGVSGTYHFEGEAKGVYLGALLGMSKVSSRAAGADYSTSPVHWGLLVGADHMFAERFSIGGEINYISISSGSTTVQGVNRDTEGFNILNLLLTAKLWI